MQVTVHEHTDGITPRRHLRRAAAVGLAALFTLIPAIALLAYDETPPDPDPPATPEGPGEIIVGEEQSYRIEDPEAGIEVRIHPDGITLGGEDRVIIERREGDPTWGRRHRRDSSTAEFAFGETILIGPDERIEGDVVVLQGDAIIEGTVEGAVVAFLGSVVVESEGEVTGDIVSFLGEVELAPGAWCGGDAVAIGGEVDNFGAELAGSAIGLSLLGTHIEEMPGLGAVIGILTGLNLAVYLFFALVLATVFRHNTARMALECSHRGFRTFWIGVGCHLGAHLLSLILIITVIGLPISLLGATVWWAISQIGLVVGATRLGQGLLGGATTGRPLLPAFLGGVVVHAIPLTGAGILATSSVSVGWLLITLGLGVVAVLTALGTGALFAARFGEAPPPLADPSGSPPEYPPADGSARGKSPNRATVS